MKRLLCSLTLLSLLSACDAPQRTRAPQTWVNGNTLENPTNQSGTLTGGSSTGTPSTGTDGTATSGFQNCDLSTKHHTIDIGWFGICQSTVDETLIKFKPSVTSTSVRTCLIPTYKSQDQSSTYIGQPQCTFTTANTVIQGKLYKDRNGFQRYPLNGVIVMKEPLLPEYFSCMQAYLNWPANVCPSGASNSYCAYWIPRCPYGAKTANGLCTTEANTYMNQVCSAFKTKYSNSYIDIRLK